jgi:hypothetical protein
MSKRVFFISFLLCLVGLWGIWHILAELLAGRIVFDTSALFFPAGLGIAMGYRHARTMASVAFGFFYLWLLLAFGFAAAEVPTVMRLTGLPPDFGPSVVYSVGLCALAIALFIHWQLYTQPFDEHLTA